MKHTQQPSVWNVPPTANWYAELFAQARRTIVSAPADLEPDHPWRTDWKRHMEEWLMPMVYANLVGTYTEHTGNSEQHIASVRSAIETRQASGDGY